MELGTIFLLLAVLAIVGMFVAKPFTEHWRAQAENGHEISSLLAERDRVLTALQELDFDYSLGKVPVEEYSAQRAILLQKGADALRRLDMLQGVQPVPAEARLETEVAAQPVTPLSDDELEDLIAKRRAVRKEKTAGFCPECGKPILQSDRFCPSCGRDVH
jgi:hypothetical protein